MIKTEYYECKKCKDGKSHVHAIDITDLKPGKPVLCPTCAKPMKKTSAAMADLAPATFADMVKKVSGAMGFGYKGSYCAAVIDCLTNDTHGQKFQPDFTLEMRKDTEVRKFIGADKRAAIADKICFDNAMGNAGFAAPPGFPKGEKFDFEIPYILKHAEWLYMDVFHGKPLFTVKFTEFLAKVKAGHQYMVSTRQNTNSQIGHMLCITIDGSGANGWIYDPQRQPMNYVGWFCEAWESPETGGESLDPKCTLDLRSGKRGDFPKK
jgi:hypothetical protein